MATSPSSTVVKAFEVLDLFRHRGQLGVSECAELLGMPRPTAHRMLVSLVAAGAVERTDSGHYRLDLGLFEIGSLVPLRRHLYDRAHPVLEALVSEVRAPVHLAVRDGTELVYILKSARSGCDRANTRIGQRNRLHATGLGKVFLAHAPPALFERVIDEGLPAYTSSTITMRSRLQEELADVARTRFAFDREERIEGVICIATDVRDRAGRVVAAISIPSDSEKVRGRVESLKAPLARARGLIENNIRSLPPSVFAPADESPMRRDDDATEVPIAMSGSPAG